MVGPNWDSTQNVVVPNWDRIGNVLELYWNRRGTVEGFLGTTLGPQTYVSGTSSDFLRHNHVFLTIG